MTTVCTSLKSAIVRFEPWLALVAYLPSLLMFLLLAPDAAPYSFVNGTRIAVTCYAIASILGSSAVLLTALVPRLDQRWRQVRGWRCERIFLVCNWVPHHLALVFLGFCVALDTGGFIT